MIFYLNLILIIIMVVSEIVKTLKRGFIISIQMILTICTFLYLFINPLLTKSVIIQDNLFNFQISVALLGIYISCRIIPYDLISSTQVDGKYNDVKYVVKKHWLIIGTVFYSLYLIWGIISAIKFYGSIGAVFSANRLSTELGANYFRTNTLLPLILLLRILYYIYIVNCFDNKKYLQFSLFVILPMINHRFVAATRFDFASMILVLMIFLFDEKRDLLRGIKDKISSRKKISLLKVAIPSFVIIISLLIYMQVSNYTRLGLDFEYKNINIFDLAFMNSITVDLNYYYFFYDIYNAVNNRLINIEYGQSWYYYQMLTFIPRIIWENKPVTAFSPRLTELLYWKLGTGSPVVTFTIFGEGYFQFKTLGCLIAPILFSVSRYFSMRVFKPIKGSKMFIILTLMSMITYLRAEQPVIYVILDFMYAFIIIKFLSKKVVDN